MAISIVAIVTEILVVLVFVCFHSLSFVTTFYCKLLIYTQECRFVVSIMTWLITIPLQEPMAQDSVTQTPNGKLMSANP